jgi:DNA primase
MVGKGDTVAQIKERLSIVDVVSSYIKLDRAGTSLRARCPFHGEKTPSFIVSPERNTFHCFGCGVGGDIFQFVILSEGIDFKGALKILAERAGVPLVYSQRDTTAERAKSRLFEVLEASTVFYEQRMTSHARAYMIGRGVVESTQRTFRLGEAGNDWTVCIEHLTNKGFTRAELLAAGVARTNERNELSDKFRNRIMFPLQDSAGRVVGFSGRIYGPHASPEAPKYLNSPETDIYHKSSFLYGYNHAKHTIRTLKCALLVEGQVDLVMSHQAGWTNTVAVSGTAFTNTHAQLIKRLTDNLLIALDGDAAGVKAASRAAHIALAHDLNVKVVPLPQGMDPADYILQNGGDKWKDCIKQAIDIVEFLLDVLERTSRDASTLRRDVESIVLPFVKVVSRPLLRDQYIRTIADRLHVTESSIIEALAKVVATATQDAPVIHTPKSTVAVYATRVRTAYGLLLWQQSITKPMCDVLVYETELRAVLKDLFIQLEAVDEQTKEQWRFDAERVYATSTTLNNEISELLNTLRRDMLAMAREETYTKIKQAEQIGDEVELDALMRQL